MCTTCVQVCIYTFGVQEVITIDRLYTLEYVLRTCVILHMCTTVGIQSLGEQELRFSPETDQSSTVPKIQSNVSSLAVMSMQAPLPRRSQHALPAEQVEKAPLPQPLPAEQVDNEGDITDSFIEEIVGGTESSEEEGTYIHTYKKAFVYCIILQH